MFPFFARLLGKRPSQRANEIYKIFSEKALRTDTGARFPMEKSFADGMINKKLIIAVVRFLFLLRSESRNIWAAAMCRMIIKSCTDFLSNATNTPSFLSNQFYPNRLTIRTRRNSRIAFIGSTRPFAFLVYTQCVP